MGPMLVAGLVFVTVVGGILGLWWTLTSEEAMRGRLAPQAATSFDAPAGELRAGASDRFPVFTRIAAALPITRGLQRLAEQGGWAASSGDVLGLMILLAIVGGVIGGARTDNRLLMLACAGVGAALPVIYFRYRGQKRMEKFANQFPEALDMMTRALRAGYALQASIQLVAEELPEPTGPEFKRLSDEIALGQHPVEALRHLRDRIDTEDTRFFYTVVSVQREVGGNLAEIFEKLSEIIRERFKLLSYARVLSAQHRASAYCIAASPFAMALMFSLMSPGFFDGLLKSPDLLLGIPIGKALIGIALICQFLGFVTLKRIANIKV